MCFSERVHQRHPWPHMKAQCIVTLGILCISFTVENVLDGLSYLFMYFILFFLPIALQQ